MNRMFLLAVAVMLLALPAALGYSVPGSPESIAANASIAEGSGTSPVIEYVWVLPDESSATGTQLNIVPSGERNDIYACIVVSDAESRDTIEDVFIDLYHPDASFKYQVHADMIDNAEMEDCKDAALAAGLISSADHEMIDYNIISQPNWYMYKVSLPMYYHQPSGVYNATAYAVDSTSRISVPEVASFEWLAGTYLELDFDSVNFGTIQPAAWKIVNGDVDMGTPDMPTLKNEGNTEVQVGVMFTDFVGQDALPNKVITDFDAQLRSMGTNNYLQIPGEHLEFGANERVDFTYPISLCRQEKIDFSIHADVGTVPDNYAGSITVYATPVIVDSPVPGEVFPVAE